MRITEFVMKKWAKAGLLIFLGIILLLYFENVLIELQPAFNFIFTGGASNLVALLYITGWLLTIWCFVDAALCLIMSFRESKLSFNDIGRKIDAIERKLSEREASAQTMGAAIGPVMPLPAPAASEKKKMSKKMKIAAVAVVVILVVAVIAVALMFLGFGSPQGGATPEEAFSSLISRMNAKDANGAIGNTVWTFSSDRGQYVDMLNQFFSNGTFQITVVSQNTIQKQNLNSTARNEMDDLESDLEQQLGINISDYVVVEYTVSIQTGQGTMTQSQAMMCAKVDGKWYVVFDFGGPGPDGSEQSTPDQTFEAFIDELNERDSYGATNLTVMKFSGNYQQDVANLEAAIFGSSSTYNMQVDNYQVISSNTFDPTQTSQMSTDMSKVSSKYGKSVQEYVLIHFTGTQNNDSGPNPVDETLPCVKIDGKWYMIVGGQGGPGPIEIQLSMNNMTGNWTVGVTNVANSSSPLSTSQVYIEVRYAHNNTLTLNMQLSSMSSGSYYKGVLFEDKNIIGQVDSGDDFILDSSIYFDGTEFKLIGPSSAVYADISL